MMAYLNQRGITNGLMPKFGGPGPLWMGGLSLTPGYENDCAEMSPRRSFMPATPNTCNLRWRPLSMSRISRHGNSP